jgi:hypothetical protein
MKLTLILIKRILYFSLPVTFLLIICCEEEKPVARIYPRITATSVINISDSGATFTADLYSLGTEVPKEYGFLWDVWGELDYNNSNKVILGKPEKIGVFTADISSCLIKERKYNVRPFVKTENRMVYGPTSTFKSLGSKAPLIHGFYPNSGGWGDTIKISGRNFSWITETNEVRLNNVKCKSVNSTDTTLFFVVDPNVIALKNAISVTLAENVNTFSKDSLKLIPPSIADYSPKNGYWGDTISIAGKYLGFLNILQTQTIKLGSQNCTVIGYPNDSLIKIKVPYEITSVSNNLVLTMNGFVLNGSVPFTLLPPYFSFSPSEGTWGSKIVLTGRFNSFLSRNKFSFGNVDATVSSTSQTKVEVTVPGSLSVSECNIIYKVIPFEVTSTTSFKLKPPMISSFTPDTGPSGTSVTIRGKYFGVNSTNVKFGNTSGTITTINDSTIVLNVPQGGFGPVKITITSAGQTIVSESYFDLKNPHIDSFTPITGTFNDEITIRGENFVPLTGNTSVKFGDIAAEIVSQSATNIVVKVPVTVDSIPRNIKVTSGANLTSSEDKFTLLPHIIYSISPGTLLSGEDIIITGQNFNPLITGNQVMFDMCYLTVKAATRSEIIATVPQGIPRGDFNIKVITGKYSRVSSQVFSVNSQWRRIQSPFLRTYDRTLPLVGIAGGGLRDYGYLCSSLDSGLTYRFDPVQDSWEKISVNAHMNLNAPPYGWNMDEVVCRDTFYIICGSPTVMLGIDQVSETWKTKNPSLFYTEDGVAFSVNDKIYFGLNYYYNKNILKEFDPANNYSSSQKANFPESLNASITTYFTIGNKGYVLFSNNRLYEYDPSIDKWKYLWDFPGASRMNAISFVIGNFAYIGTGYNGSTIYGDIWKFDPATYNSFTLVSNIPNPRRNAVALTIKNKGYIGYGIDKSGNLFDFYEFDPNYPLK